MNPLATLRFFATPTHPCSYLNRDDATTLFVDPKLPLNQDIYSLLNEKGFRRSGSYVYRPHCKQCSACIPVRISIAEYQPSKRHKRIIKRNADLVCRLAPAHFSQTHYALYARYISLRHSDGDMFPPTEDQYTSFILSDWAGTQFLEFLDEDRLVAVAVMDQLNKGLSAIYTFFDPMAHSRSLGVYAILKQIDLCKQRALPHLYLGYWVKNCRKMSYKNEFQALEAFRNHKWEPLDTSF
ncbi:MAG: arginyltransferase [Gammaproteobacteria bacterium]